MQTFLIADSTIYENGESAAIALSGRMLFTLGILDVVEQETLLLGIHGSHDGTGWNPDPVVQFPEKFYPGISAVLVDAARHPGVAFVRAEWKVNRWGRGSKQPSFRMYLFAERLLERL